MSRTIDRMKEEHGLGEAAANLLEVALTVAQTLDCSPVIPYGELEARFGDGIPYRGSRETVRSALQELERKELMTRLNEGWAVCKTESRTGAPLLLMGPRKNIPTRKHFQVLLPMPKNQSASEADRILEWRIDDLCPKEAAEEHWGYEEAVELVGSSVRALEALAKQLDGWSDGRAGGVIDPGIASSRSSGLFVGQFQSMPIMLKGNRDLSEPSHR